MPVHALDEFQGPQLLGYVRSLPVPAPFLASRWLPALNTFDLEVSYIKGANKRPVMAHVLAYGAEAPIAGRKPLGQRVDLELPPIKRKTVLDEREIIRFDQPRAGTPDKQSAIDSVFNTVDDMVNSVRARIEWLCMKALSEDTVVYDEAGIKFGFDYGITDNFQIDLTTQLDGDSTDISSLVSTTWDDTTNANPIADLQYACDLIEDSTGIRPIEFVCSRKALGYILNNAKVRGLIRGASAPSAVLTRNELDTALNLYGLPPIFTYDTKVRSEASNGTITEVRCMAENRAFLVPGGDPVLPGHSTIGATLFGPTAEARADLFGTPAQVQAPGIYAQVWGEKEPPEKWVKAAAVAFPSLPGADRLGQFKLWAD